MTEVMKQYGIREDQLALVGSSAGGMIALYTVHRRATPLASIVAFAATVIHPPPPGHTTPVCMIYGDKDHFYPRQQSSVAALRAANVSVEQHIRPGLGHEVDMPGVALAAKCLQKAFRP